MIPLDTKYTSNDISSNKFFYLDKHKNFSVYSAGKQGTTTLAHVIQNQYVNKKITHSNLSYSPYLFLESDPAPVYVVSYDQYASFRMSSNIQSNFIVMRNPRERLISGIVQNIFLLQVVDKYPVLTEDALYRDIQKIIDYNYAHTGKFLTEISLRLLKTSTIVKLDRLDTFIRTYFNTSINENANTDNNTPQINIDNSFSKVLHTTTTNKQAIKQYIVNNFDTLLPASYKQLIAEESAIYKRYDNK